MAENIFAGQEKEFSKLGVISMGKMYKAAQQVLEKFGIGHIKARDPIDRYTFEDRKLIEIARCVTDDTQILVVDETTMALSLKAVKSSTNWSTSWPTRARAWYLSPTTWTKF